MGDATVLYGCMRIARRDHMVTKYTWSPNQMWARGFARLSTALLVCAEARAYSGIDVSGCKGNLRILLLLHLAWY